MFSKACEYGIKAMIFIAHESAAGRRVSLKEVAGSIDSPEAFTAKILQQLRKADLLNSVRGTAGGFELKKGGDEIRLAGIVTAIDGLKVITGCGLGLEACSDDKPCPIHDKFKHVRDGLQAMLESSSLRDLSEGVNIGTTFLKRE
jgi:Rrf2 family transcriptional regulator, iron-sulfur cluster assembly transcription factor